MTKHREEYIAAYNDGVNAAINFTKSTAAGYKANVFREKRTSDEVMADRFVYFAFCGQVRHLSGLLLSPCDRCGITIHGNSDHCFECPAEEP